MQDPAFGRSFAFEADVFEKSRIPQGIKVPFNGSLIVDIPRLSENVGTHDIRRHRAISMNLKFSDHVGLLRQYDTS